MVVDLGDGVRAAFTTRACGDMRADRALVERWAGGPVAFATQVHGADVVVVEQGSTAVGECDALVSASGAGVGVLVADCVPVLLSDPQAGVVGAVHAGRRGLAGGVVQAALAVMIASGARPERVRAAIGPAICGECYEVPAALRDEVAGVVPATWATTPAGTAALDLPAGVAALLAAAGVRHVARIAICTRTDERFFSYRRAPRDGYAAGRFAGVIRWVNPRPGRVGGRSLPGDC